MRYATLGWISLMVAAASAPAAGTECANNIPVQTGAMQKIISCLADLQKENAELSKQLADIKDQQRAAYQDRLPEHSILALDSPKGCPAGWTDLGREDAFRFAGRTIVAVGPRTERGDNNNLTTVRREYGDQGGSEAHALREGEIPPLDFSFEITTATVSTVDRYNAGGQDYPVIGGKQDTISGQTGGDGDAFPTMPPYIAMYLCRKDER